MLSKLILAEYIYFGPILICLISNWTFFIRNNFLSAKIKAAKTDKLQKVNIVKKINIRVFFRWGIILNILVLIFLHTTRGHEGPVLYNHFYVSNFNFSVISFLIIVSTLLLYVAKNTDPRNSNLNVDYAFSVSSINIFIQTLFLVNSIYTLVFFLEITSVLIFYKFVSSRFWFKQKTKAGEKNSKFDFVLPKSYVNVMFFQYWANFFSSVIMIFSVVTLSFMYGSTEFYYLSSLIDGQLALKPAANKSSLVLVWLPLLTSFLIKIGLAPLHLFKVEIYKGIPFMSLFFYTVYYFTGYFLLLGVLVIVYLKNITLYWFFIGFAVFFVGSSYILSLLFNINYTKAFFAYSTIINALNFFCIILSSF